MSDLPHDERLYTTQILLVLTSSPLAWVGDGFHILGFSMGGGVAADFAVAFPGIPREWLGTMFTNVLCMEFRLWGRVPVESMAS